MDMAAKFQDQLMFHMTGKRSGDGLAPIDVGALRPALLAGYRDLARLRYDFPLVLPEAAAERTGRTCIRCRRSSARCWRSSPRAESKASACASTCCASSASCAWCSPRARRARWPSCGRPPR